MTSQRTVGLGLVVATGILSAGCLPGDSRPAFRDPDVSTGALRLVGYDSCAQAMDNLKSAAKAVVGPYGFGGTHGTSGPENARADAAAPAPAVGAAPAEGVDYSGTNTHEVSADEPDQVKTDGRRIVTLTDGTLRVTDATSRRITGELRLAQNGADQLLLSGDRALVLTRGVPEWKSDGEMSGPESSLVLVDLSAAPRVLATLTVDGSYLDARQTGSTARIVVRSSPRLTFPNPESSGSQQRQVDANRAVIDRATAADWLPRYHLDVNGRVVDGMVDCGDVHRPESYTGANMLTVYTVLLETQTPTAGDPVTIIADGETVYGTGGSLYIASDDRWREMFWRGDGVTRQDARVRTELYKFTFTDQGRPSFAAAGAVPGWLINQYALSEHDGHLRVATTTDRTGWGGETRSASSSAVYVLRQQGDVLDEVGSVDGLGKGERIYAVRFAGPVGYVVTFRQVDPLYVLDLRAPQRPQVTGELKISGYSAYLHPAGDGRLIGVGQEASESGRVQGTQVTLFDVSDPGTPAAVSRYHIPGAWSEAEFDPHAFLYWPGTKLLVIPLSQQSFAASGSAVGLTVADSGIHEVSTVKGIGEQILRALVIGDTVWLLSNRGLTAHDLGTLALRYTVDFT
ncbi:MAG: beta-propeller domain-containing protein [Longispora sp.]|nr:beta-propeller domain-containing protein [Longispora sp. (in: high G+C Gram-positive bacteria)]